MKKIFQISTLLIFLIGVSYINTLAEDVNSESSTVTEQNIDTSIEENVMDDVKSGDEPLIVQSSEQSGSMDNPPDKPAEKPMMDMGNTVNTIENISIDVNNNVGLVTITTTSTAEYEEMEKEASKYSIKLHNVILDDRLQVARDVSDFDTPLSFLSSFRDPLNESDVIIIAEMKEQADVQLMQTNNVIKLKFGKSPEEIMSEELEEKNEEEELWAFDIRSASVSRGDKIYKGQLVSFDFKDADVRDVLRILADISGFNLIIHSGVRGTVTLRLANVPWDQAMEIVLEEKGLGATIEGNILKIAPLGVIQNRLQARLQAASSQESTEPLVTRQIFINYATAAQLIPLIDSKLSGRGTMRVDVRTNSILVTDTESRIASVEDLVAVLDTATPQVLIESRIVQASLDFTRQLGVQWGLNYIASAATGNPTGAVFPSSVAVGGTNPSAGIGTIPNDFIIDMPAPTGQGSGAAVGLLLGSLTGAYDLDIRLSALENRGDGRVLSSPKVLTLNNQAATITQGVSIPFLSVSSAGTQTQFVDATLTLDVTPQVTNDDKVLLDINVQDNAPDPAVTGAGGQPGIRRNEAQTNILASDGETIVIGGIFTRTANENYNGVPWFSRLPIFGFLFRNNQTVDLRRELLVFITPRIIRQ